MKVTTLQQVNIRKLILPVVYGTTNVSDEALKLGDQGLKTLEILIRTALEHDLVSNALEIEKLVDVTVSGLTANSAIGNINKLMKVAHDKYDGKFEPPAIGDPEKMFYFLLAYTLADCGRVSEDPIEWSVRWNMDTLFDMGAIETAHDMACWAFLVEYFEDCLNRGERIPITRYFKNYGRAMVTPRRLEAFLKKNYWYGDADESKRLFMLDTESPAVSSITGAALEFFTRIYEEKLEEIEEEEQQEK